MGCFPDKTQEKNIENNPEKRRLLDYSRLQTSEYFRANHLYPSDVRRSLDAKYPPRPQSKRAFPVSRHRRKSSDYKKKAQIIDKKQQQAQKLLKYVRKSEGHPQQHRKRGKIIQLPFRPHIITQIETPSQSIKTSFLVNAEQHPSIFFLKPNILQEQQQTRSYQQPKEPRRPTSLTTRSHLPY